MKFFYTVILFCLSLSCISQKIQVPYRSGKLFGISDENGKIIVKPAYDHVKWMWGTWFETSRKVELNDTLETAPQKYYVRKKTIQLSGLINNGKVVLNDEPFDAYEIVANKCIVSKYEGRGTSLTKEQYKKYGDKRKLFCLFNLQGQNLYPDGFKSIQKMDTTGVSNKNKNTGRFILFWVVHFNNKHSLLVFDADKQEISDWLVKDAYKLEPDRGRTTPQQIMIAITDSSMNSSVQLLDYSSGKFELQPTTATIQPKKRRHDDVQVVESFSGSGTGSGQGDYVGEAIVEAPTAPVNRAPRPEPAFNPYHTFARDSLFYITSYKNMIPVQLPANAKIIRMVPYSMTQYQPVMVIVDNHFYIVSKDKMGETVYDSLVYFGSNFLAWKKVNGKTKAGVISNTDSIIIPFEYDSLYAGIRYLQLVDKKPASNTRDYKIEFKEADSKYSQGTVNPYVRSHTNHFTVFRNDKCGVINFKNNTVVPFKYNVIARNSMGHSRPSEDEFILLKENGLYGITTLRYDKQMNQDVMNSNTTIEPVYEYLPGFFYPNYFGVKGYVLIGLYDEQFNFMGFATEKGKTFYDKR